MSTTQRIRRFTSHGVAQYAAASLLTRGVAALSVLVLTPLIISQLGLDAYAFWVLATQIPSLVVSPDLGLGQSILNRLNASVRRDGHLDADASLLSAVQTALVCTAVCWTVVGLGVIAAYSEVVDLPTEAISAFIVALVAFTLSIPASLHVRVRLAFERGAVPICYEGAARTVALVLSTVVLLVTPNLVLLVAATSVPVAAGLLIHALILRRTVSFGRRGSLSRSVVAEVRPYALKGLQFVALQVCFVLGAASDPYLVAFALGPSDVALLSVIRRPFDVLPLVLTLFTTSLWPVLSRQWEEDRSRFRRTTTAILLSSTTCLVTLSTLIMAAQGPIYGFLAQDQVRPTSLDVFWAAVLTVSTSITLFVTVILNAVDRISLQVRIVVFATIVIVPLKVLAATLDDLSTFIAVAAVGHLVLICLPLTWTAIRLAPNGKE